MRLGQLARKLALRPGDIVEFLAENNIRIADGANARLENAQVTLIMKRFVPGWTEVSEAEPEPVVEEDTSIELNAEQEITPESVAAEQGQSADETAREQIIDGHTLFFILGKLPSRPGIIAIVVLHPDTSCL